MGKSSLISDRRVARTLTAEKTTEKIKKNKLINKTTVSSSHRKPHPILTCVMTLSLKDISFKRPFYQAPVLLLSPEHKWNKGKSGKINPENNAITSWVEVSIFGHFNNTYIAG